MNADQAVQMMKSTGKEVSRLCEALDRRDNERLIALLTAAVTIPSWHDQLETVADIVSTIADMVKDDDAQEYLRDAVSDCRFRARELEQEAAEACAEDMKTEKRRLRRSRGEIV